MKFKVDNKEIGYICKNSIESTIFEKGWISLKEVKFLVPSITAYDDVDAFIGWDKLAYLQRKIRVRETKNGWYLYLPEPSRMTWNDEEHMNIKGSNLSNPAEKFIELFEENSERTDDYIEKEIEAINGVTRALGCMNVDIYTRLEKLMNMIGANSGYFYRPCIVKAKKSGRKEERQDRKAYFHRWVDLSKGVQQVVALVEFEDGHVEQVQPDRIIFKEE